MPELRQGTLKRTSAALVCAAALLVVCATPDAAAQGYGGREPHAQAYLHYALGHLLEVSGALSDALVQYRRAETLDPERCELGIAVARTLYALGNLEAAEERGGRALAQCPGSLEATALLAEILLVLERPGETESLIAERAVAPDAPRELAALYGQALLSQGKFEEASAFLRERSEADSTDPDTAAMYGRALLLMDDSEGAVKQLRRSARLDPNNRAVTGMLGRLLIAIDRPEEGVPLLEWLHSRFEAVEPEYISLAAGHSMLGDAGRAHSVLDSAAVKFGETVRILRARAATYFREGELDEAVDTYEKLLEQAPDSVTALNFVAYTLADENRDLPHALDYARRAVELEGDNPLLRDTLGWAHYRMGDLEKARRELQLAIELGGDSPVILEHLGDVLHDLGETDAAVEAWTRALELSPGTPSTIERLEGAGAAIPTGLQEEDGGGE